MNNLTDSPLLVFVLSWLLLWISARIGAALIKQRGHLEAAAREDFGVIQAATLTLLGLIIGFSFSMATSRYDLRKNYEEQEANAIGTEFLRADLLPPAQAAAVRELLTRYTHERIRFYETSDAQQLRSINTATTQLQSELWTTARTARPAPLLATLVISGMNDVLTAQGYAQAAWWNRLPRPAWALMLVTAICSNVLVGYGVRSRQSRMLLVVLPLVVSVAFTLIADIDSPRSGVIRVQPQNLNAFAQSLPPLQPVNPAPSTP
jgi:hypothetical protein